MCLLSVNVSVISSEKSHEQGGFSEALWERERDRAVVRSTVVETTDLWTAYLLRSVK